MKNADRIGAHYTIVLGESEVTENKAILKNMKLKEQIECSLDAESIAKAIEKGSN